ncbi:hypothetical protein SCB71_06280 [Herbiconiux sp. KACC 21604]|uniref:hypothetical protein n=1 Tax=unclassified Herbiconiux TaxID=2618217 RepID=UPI0014916E98|nr:hypothetical protein [Herbiconiux sp. SALV-R1]QJU52925.1 hypothetical protein HL652_04265 [Herbiconiux sp. SALV-R1]WPO87845.1 hypothetical protein SCB71_06280 [Herbiconiux sp. KACC 21604]
MYEVTISDTQSGDALLAFTGDEAPSACTWGTRINGFDTGQTTFETRAIGGGLTRADWRELIDPWRRTVDVGWRDDTTGILSPLLPHSGLIMGWNYDKNTGQMSVASAEARTILTRRMLFGVGTYGIGTRVITEKSIAGMIKQILWYATQGNLSVVWNMPFEFELFQESGIHGSTYWNYLFEDAEQLISDWQNTAGGPDVHWQGRRHDDTGKRDWLVRIGGTAGGPRLTGAVKQYMSAGEAIDIFNVTEAGDGTPMRTGTMALGSGSDEDILHGEAATVAVPGGYPSLDVVDQFTNIDDLERLTALAVAGTAAAKEPTKQLAGDVLARDFFPDGQVGSTIDIWDQDDMWLDDGWTSRYCVGFTGDLNETIKLQMQGV